jgi:hypothetical protein
MYNHLTQIFCQPFECLLKLFHVCLNQNTSHSAVPVSYDIFASRTHHHYIVMAYGVVAHHCQCQQTTFECYMISSCQNGYEKSTDLAGISTGTKDENRSEIVHCKNASTQHQHSWPKQRHSTWDNPEQIFRKTKPFSRLLKLRQRLFANGFTCKWH